MPLTLTPTQKLANSFGSHTFTVSGTEIVITGKRGVLTYLGLTIDQVYHSPGLAIMTRSLGRPTGSDHRPVVTEITRARR
jgi:endonuclease/exonuclease/phosphatase (EEP) superfamily protein YafD